VAFDLLIGWNSGHPGAVTVHANSAYSALLKMELLASLASEAPLQGMIGQVVNWVVFIEKHNGSRRIKEVMRVHGYDGVKYQTESLEG